MNLDERFPVTTNNLIIPMPRFLIEYAERYAIEKIGMDVRAVLNPTAPEDEEFQKRLNIAKSK